MSEEWDWEIGQSEESDDHGGSSSNGKNKSVSPQGHRSKINGGTGGVGINTDAKQIALSLGSKSLQKGITSSPSFQELERAIGATLALSLNSEHVQNANSDSPKTGLVSSNSANKLMNQRFGPNQQRRGRQHQHHSQDDLDQANTANGQRQSKSQMEVAERTKTELSAYVNESESRAIILFHSPHISPVAVRDACLKWGVLYYIRPEFHGKGVTLLSYFDLRSAIHAYGSLAEELGAEAAASAHYSVMLHAANNNTEEFRLIVRQFPEGCLESDIQSIFSRYGQLRSIQRTFGETEITDTNNVSSEASAYSIEYYNIQDSRLAASELSATSAQIWDPNTVVTFASLDSRKQQLCRQLLATLSRWRTEMAARIAPPASAATSYHVPMALVGAQGSMPYGIYGNGGQQSAGGPLMLPAGYVQNSMQMPMQMPMNMMQYGISYHPNQSAHMGFDHHYQIMSNNAAVASSDSGNDRAIHDNGRLHKLSPDWQGGQHNFHQNRLPAKAHIFDNQRPLYHNGGHAQNRARIKLNTPAPDTDFALDMDKLLGGTETRTTVMVRNIPNKYSQQMLLEEVDVNHKGTYDFFYLPIDFKNKCNVGYCFINFLEPKFITPFVEEFNGQRWKSFNSEKVCAVSYARIQGKGAMVARFQNSSLLEKEGEYRPLLFISTGPDKGKPEPFPSVYNRRQSNNDNIDNAEDF